MKRGFIFIIFTNVLFSATFTVTKSIDTNDGACNEDCSLREAIIAANLNPGEDTIVIPSGVYEISIKNSSQNDETEAREGDLDINDDLLIVGKGMDKTIISSNIESRIFFVDRYKKGVSVKIRDLTIKGGESSYGGAIENNGNLILTRVAIKNSVALNGGGVFSTRFLKMENCKLLDNRASTAGEKSNGFGGGVFIKGEGIFEKTIFQNNSSNRDGGGLYVKDGSKVKIERCNFIENRSDAKGGGLFSDGKIYINDTVFEENRANDGGGAAFHINSDSTLINARFLGNMAVGEDLGGGGAIFNFEGKLSIDRSKFESNYALGEGGGAIESKGDLKLYNSIFLKNEAKNHSAYKLPPNTSPGFGGALLFIDGSNNDLENILLQENRAYRNGGAIYNDKNVVLNILDSDFISNKALSKYGGAIYNDGALDIKYSLFSKNYAKLLGGAVASNDGESLFGDCDFISNRSDENGGALYNSPGSSKMTLYNSRFFLNSAASFGGAVLNQSLMDIYFCDFEKNSAEKNGGAIYNKDKKLILKYSTFKENNVKGSGGAIWSEEGLDIDRSSFVSNRADKFAGAVGSNSDIFVKESIFSKNVANDSGGALALFKGAVLDMDKSLLSFNRSQRYGGGVLNSSSKITAINSTFAFNGSNLGGAISNNDSKASVKLTHTTFAYNSASQNSSAFLNYQGKFTIANSLFKDECHNQGEIDSLGGNVEFDHSGCAFGEDGDLMGVSSSGLGDLADNGGRSDTVAISFDSLAVGNGDGALCEDEDQRGYERDSCDSGAYEHSYVLNPLKTDMFKAISYDTPRKKRINRGDILNIGLKVINENEEEVKNVTIEIPMAKGLDFEDVVLSRGKVIKKSPYVQVQIESLAPKEAVNITAVAKVMKREEGSIEVVADIFASNAKRVREKITFDVVDADALESFVKRFYTNVLQRGYDIAGLNYWVGVIKTKEKTPQEAALGFFNSKEFKNKDLSDKEFIKIVYNTFFDRDPDDNGERYWLSQLANGMKRIAVVRGFTYSDEFKRLVKSFGL